MLSTGPIVYRPMPAFLNQPAPVRPAAVAPMASASRIDGGPAGPDVLANVKVLATTVWTSLKSLANQLFQAVSQALNAH